MLKSKIMLLSLIAGIIALPVSSAEILPDIEHPKPPAYRVGISEVPENQYIQAEEQKTAVIEKTYTRVDNSREAELADYTYADLDLKRMSKDISQELEYDGQDMLADLSLLWQGAAMQSETINFALYKLANPDADKPDEKSIKKVLTTIASMSTLVGASIGSPVIAGTSLISGNVLGIMAQDTKALNYKYTRVTDADMIILIRKVEDLQQKTVDLYYDYMSAKKQLEMVNNLVDERKTKFEYAQTNNAPRELIVITDAYYRTALDRQRTAKSEFLSKRAALEQFVGNQTLLQFENELIARENGEKTQTAAADEEKQNAEYEKTVQNVENYTQKSANAVPAGAQPAENQTAAAVRDIQPQEQNTGELQASQTTATDSRSEISSNIQEHPDSAQLQLRDYEQNKLNIAENRTEPKTDKITGLSSNLEPDEDNVDAENSKKSKKKAEKKEKKIKKKKINEHLIFLHSERQQQPQAQENGNANIDADINADENVSKKQKKKEKRGKNKQQETVENSPQQTAPAQPKAKQNSFDTSGLMPLDEIKPPKLDGSYSIHSEYDYGDSYGDSSVQF